MSETITIMLADLSTEAQREVLDFFGYQTPEEGNFDIVPLFVLEKDERERKEP